MDDLNESERIEEGSPSSSTFSGILSGSGRRHSKTRSTSRDEASPTGIPSTGRGDDRGNGGRGDGGSGGSSGRSTPGEGRGVDDSSFDDFARSLRNICPLTLEGDGTQVEPTDHPATYGKVGDRLSFYMCLPLT